MAIRAGIAASSKRSDTGSGPRSAPRPAPVRRGVTWSGGELVSSSRCGRVSRGAGGEGADGVGRTVQGPVVVHDGDAGVPTAVSPAVGALLLVALRNSTQRRLRLTGRS